MVNFAEEKQVTEERRKEPGMTEDSIFEMEDIGMPEERRELLLLLFLL